jgi:four helix bundle protein
LPKDFAGSVAPLAAYLHHLDIARGSEGELFTQLEIARRLGYVAQKRLTHPLAELTEIGKMLNALISVLEAKRGQAAR